ncbi:hypothetical protein ACROYT_G013935 [Oculina patagonica]
MPPKCSQCLRNPSAQVDEIAAGAVPQRRKRAASQPAMDTQHKKSRRGTSAQTSENWTPPAVVETNQSASSSGAAAGGPQPLSFPQGVLDQLVAQVADEVTRHLSPPEDCGTANRNTLVSNAASELPLVSNLPPAIPVPGAAVATSGLAVTVLQRSVGATQASLSDSRIQTRAYNVLRSKFPSLDAAEVHNKLTLNYCLEELDLSDQRENRMCRSTTVVDKLTQTPALEKTANQPFTQLHRPQQLLVWRMLRMLARSPTCHFSNSLLRMA